MQSVIRIEHLAAPFWFQTLSQRKPAFVPPVIVHQVSRGYPKSHEGVIVVINPGCVPPSVSHARDRTSDCGSSERADQHHPNLYPNFVRDSRKQSNASTKSNANNDGCGLHVASGTYTSVLQYCSVFHRLLRTSGTCRSMPRASKRVGCSISTSHDCHADGFATFRRRLIRNTY